MSTPEPLVDGDHQLEHEGEEEGPTRSQRTLLILFSLFGIIALSVYWGWRSGWFFSDSDDSGGAESPTPTQEPPASDPSLLAPISTAKPSTLLFPPMKRATMAPFSNEVVGPKHTNKFWGNWVVDDGQGQLSIFPSPYTLRWDENGGLLVFKGETDYQTSTFFTNHWWPDFRISAVEELETGYTVIREDHFGIHVQKKAPGQGCTITFPIYAGMAYVTARYEQGCTPQVDTTFALDGITKVRPGVWRFKKGQSPNNKEYMVYVLMADGNFVDDSYDFEADGKLNKQLDGWLRLADVQKPGDSDVLDNSADTILWGWDFDVHAGKLLYNFETVPSESDKLLHWTYSNHVTLLSGGARVAETLTKTRSPVKGNMIPFVGGNQWTMTMDISEAMTVSFLPAKEPRQEWDADLRSEVGNDWAWMKDSWRKELHKRDHYFSGKGFQKLATLCHMLAKYEGREHQATQDCISTLHGAFECMYDRSVSDGSDRKEKDDNGESLQLDGCWWSPFGTDYDEDWGGIPSRWDDSPTCGLDFGNSCYNDHHYHWGYYLVGGAMLVDLMPSMREEPKFVELIEMFIRDVGNPSKEDVYFPQFRSFDWFDMHSWSRGIKPEPSGKDQESTSEEVNFHYGLKLWGDVTHNAKATELGATMLVASAESLQDYFLMKRDNPNHPYEFALNHVTGIFFQNKVHITTWFGPKREYVHGIQMLPLTAALPLSRKPSFAWEEWIDQVSLLDESLTDPWWSILLSGNLAMHDPDTAWPKLKAMDATDMDDGLLKSWALYWTAIQTKYEGHDLYVPTTQEPVSGGEPCGDGPCCDPDSDPPQLCPGGIDCPQCGHAACQCPSNSLLF